MPCLYPESKTDLGLFLSASLTLGHRYRCLPSKDSDGTTSTNSLIGWRSTLHRWSLMCTSGLERCGGITFTFVLRFSPSRDVSSQVFEKYDSVQRNETVCRIAKPKLCSKARRADDTLTDTGKACFWISDKRSRLWLDQR